KLPGQLLHRRTPDHHWSGRPRVDEPRRLHHGQNGQLRNLSGTATIMITQAPGPTLLGVDVILAGTVLAGIAAVAMMFVIYAAVTVRDPMAKRVKSLNARREELKAGIIKQSARKRQTLMRRTEATDKVK